MKTSSHQTDGENTSPVVMHVLYMRDARTITLINCEDLPGWPQATTSINIQKSPTNMTLGKREEEIVQQSRHTEARAAPH